MANVSSVAHSSGHSLFCQLFLLLFCLLSQWLNPSPRTSSQLLHSSPSLHLVSIYMRLRLHSFPPVTDLTTEEQLGLSWFTTLLGGLPTTTLAPGWQMHVTSPTRTQSYSSLAIRQTWMHRWVFWGRLITYQCVEWSHELRALICFLYNLAMK